VTQLENIEASRRDTRRPEYGDERDPDVRAFLLKVAPVMNADKIRRPLFLAHGQNDPRVPVTESEQMAAAVRENGASGSSWRRTSLARQASASHTPGRSSWSSIAELGARRSALTCSAALQGCLESAMSEHKGKVVHYTDVPADVVGEPAKGASMRWLIDDTHDGAPVYALRMVELAPGGHSPHHHHPYEHENFVVEGQGRVLMEESGDLKPGDVVYVPPTGPLRECRRATSALCVFHPKLRDRMISWTSDRAYFKGCWRFVALRRSAGLWAARPAAAAPPARVRFVGQNWFAQHALWGCGARRVPPLFLTRTACSADQCYL
jgi:quercetin dioxygenase-like cupin family protein